MPTNLYKGALVLGSTLYYGIPLLYMTNGAPNKFRARSQLFHEE